MSNELNQQLSLRITQEQRNFLREEMDELRSRHHLVKVCEADAVRAIIERARLEKKGLQAGRLKDAPKQRG